MNKRLAVLTGLAVASLVVNEGLARPNGGEFDVSSPTAYDQILPRVASDDNGDFVVVWSSADQDGSGWGVFARGFSGNLPVGDEFQVNVVTEGNQTAGDVTLMQGSTYAFGFGENLRLMASDGIPSTGEIVAGTTAVGSSYDVVELEVVSGTLIAVMENGPPDEFWVRAFGAGGSPLIDPYLLASGFYQSMTATDDAAIFAWMSPNLGPAKAVVLDPSGTQQGVEFDLNNIASNRDASNPRLGANAGSWVATFSLDPSVNWELWARQFDSDHNPVADSFLVDLESASDVEYYEQDVAVMDDGRFVVVWEGFEYLLGQLYEANGDPIGGPFVIADNGSNPVVVAIDPTRFAVVYQFWNSVNDRDIVGRLFDFEPPGTVAGFEIADITVNETDGEALVVVSRTGDPLGDAEVTLRTEDDTADYSDYSGFNEQILYWEAGDATSRTVAIAITDDTFQEGDESFLVIIENPTWDITLGAAATATVTIVDDDGGVVAFSSANYSVNEPDGTVDIVLTRTGAASGGGSVDLTSGGGTATPGDDYTAITTTVTWAAGDFTAKVVPVTIVDDDLLEGTETVGFSLTNPTGDVQIGTPGASQLEILDDERSDLQFTTSTESVLERDGAVSLTVTRTGSLNGAVTVRAVSADGSATSGLDYTAVNQNLTWAFGDGSDRTVTVTVSEDLLLEPDETLTLSLQDPLGGATVGSPDSATITIVDTTSMVRFAAAGVEVAEPDLTTDVVIERVGDLAGAMQISYASANETALAGSDYVAIAGTLSWADGVGGPQSVPLTIVDDTEVEGGETLTVSLSNPVGTSVIGEPSELIVSINDDEWTEFQVNVTTVEEQTRPSVALDGSGRLIAVWDSWDQDGDNWGVYGRRFAADGSPLGGEFGLAQRTAFDQREVAVAAAPDGRFVAVWETWTWPVSRVATAEIVARAWDASGNPLTGEVQVNETSLGKARAPAVAFDTAGNVLVVWQALDLDGSGEGIFARAFTPGLNPLSAETRVNAYTTGNQHRPAVTGCGGSGFMVAFESVGQYGTGADIIARRLTSSGSLSGAEVLVNQAAAGDQMRPAIGCWSSGAGIVVWEDLQGLDGDGASIRARWLDASGTPIGAEQTINGYGSSDQTRPGVAMGDDAALITWESLGQDGSGRGVFLRFVDGFGPIDVERRANVRAANSQYRAAVAMNGNDAAVLWASAEQDGSGDGIFGWRSYGWVGGDYIIFSDGFESGDASAWSSTVP